MGGDWNSVLTQKDTSKPTNACYFKTLKSILNTFKYKDIFSHPEKQRPEYTYYRRNYAARLDRIYLNKLFSNIKDNYTYPTCFSDHLCVCVSMDINTQIHVARPRWRLNVSLLENENVQSNFCRTWSYIIERKYMFTNIIQW